MLFDLPLDQLQTYRPARNEPADFDAFWAQTLAEARQFPLEAKFEPVEAGLKLVEAFDVTYNGYGGQPIKGWLLLPKQRSGALPCVVDYIGYGGGRGLPHEWLLWASAGYANLVMDTRGQGSNWRTGDTGDPEPDGTNPHYPGFMTRGILNPKNYYYRRVFTDAVRAVEAARAHPAVDARCIAVTGGSQGGGITLAVAGLVPDLAASMADVPFLCCYRRATEITDGYPYQEIVKYCQSHRNSIDTVFNTLAYFDGVMDETCPPSTVFAAYNHYAGPKQIRTWAFNHHEGGQAFQDIEKLKFLANLWQ